MSPYKQALRMALIYMLVGAVWILFSDRAVELVFSNQTELTQVQTMKGWFFVLVTGLLFFYLAYSTMRRQKALYERDSLTQLLNWFMFRQALHDRLHRLQAESAELAVVVLNIDNFRQLNSRLGQRAADTILMTFADILRELLPAKSLAARIAADEFIVAIEDSPANEKAINLVRQVQSRLHGLRAEDGSALQLHCAAGIANFPHDAKNSKDLIASANLALAESKECGQGSLCLYSQSYSDSVNARLQLTLDLKQAIARDELSLVYQPQFRDGDSRADCVEVLLRWSHPLHGPVAPDVFIALAEQQGFISELTDFVCERALKELGDAGMLDQLEHVSINVSAHDLTHTDALEAFKRRFANVPDGTCIQLEITETAVMSNLGRAVSLLHELKTLGMRISIDDFGTGYSSLGVIRQLPVDELKIDRTFIQDLETSDSDQLIVRAILAMAHALDLQVVAEGVENNGQARLLKSFGCDFFQGYYFGRPVSIHQLKALYGPRHASSESGT